MHCTAPNLREGGSQEERFVGLMFDAVYYRGYSKLRTRTVLGSYGRAMPRGIGAP